MTSGVNRLKELLFDDEAQRLAAVQQRIDALSSQETARHEELTRRQGELQRRVDAVFDRTGTAERLQTSVAAIIDGALREAEVTKHEQLSQAVAPLVVKTIKYELKHSQDEMVDALYPLTGRLVKQYVQTAMADLMADINRRLGGQRPSEIEARARSMGLTVSELVLAETQELKVDELFLVRRGSGDLLAHWEREIDGGVTGTAGAGSNRDVLIAGYLSGITAFSEEAFDDRKGSLRSLDMDGERIFVRASAAHLLAARCSGRAPASVEQIIDDEFVRVLADYQRATDGSADAGPPVDTLLPKLAANFADRFQVERRKIEDSARAASKSGGLGRLYTIAALILLPILGWLAWTSWQRWQSNRLLGEARRIVESTSELKGFPLSLSAPRGNWSLAVGGLTPNEGVRDGLIGALQHALPGTAVIDNTGVLPRPPGIARPPDLTPELAALRRDLASAREQSTATASRLAALQASVAPVPDRLSALQSALPDLQSRTAALDAAIARLDERLRNLPPPIAAPPPAPSPRATLDAFAQANAIFFANGTDFLDERRAAAIIDSLADLIKAFDGLVRVVGYTDERGTSTANLQLAQSRADRVAQMLLARDVPRERVAAIGRVVGQELSRATGPGSANRRVSFELGYLGEPTP